MKKQKRPIIVNLAIVTVTTVVVWIGFDIYRILTQKPNPQVPPRILEPINPKLDTEMLERASTRLYIDESQIQDTYLELGGYSSQPIYTQTDEISTLIEQLNQDSTESAQTATEEGELES